jgi:hypothetical protein
VNSPFGILSKQVAGCTQATNGDLHRKPHDSAAAVLQQHGGDTCALAATSPLSQQSHLVGCYVENGEKANQHDHYFSSILYA